MTERNEAPCERDKIKFSMITNIGGEENKKTIEMRLNAKLIGFIELYEELFGIDLYAYKIKFFDMSTGAEINTLSQADRSKGEASVQLYVEAPGG
jgi:hypothetical protein